MKISVIIPTFNAAKTLSRAVTGILSQTEAVHEIIVVDDGSTDETAEIVKSFTGIKYIYQKNSGPAAARNKGVMASTGDYLAFLDSDDYWEPEHIEGITTPLKLDHNLKWAASAYRKKEITGGETIVRLKKRCYLPDNRTDYFVATRKAHFLSVISVVVKREFFLSAGGFPEKYSRGEDLSLWLRLAVSDSRMGYSPHATAVYVSTRNSLTTVKGDNKINLQRIIDDYNLILNYPEEKQKKAWKVIKPWLNGLFIKLIRARDCESMNIIARTFSRHLNMIQVILIKLIRWTLRYL